MSEPAGLERKLVHGLRPQFVELAEYDPRWPATFARLRDRIVAALGARARFVEHIGSTAVPGLAAKPVIDIVAGIDDPDDEPAYLPDLTALGYTLSVREPGHRCLRGGADGADADGDMRVNLHCYPPDSDEVHRYRLLRDRLRSHHDDRVAYEVAKRSLAGREWPDVNFYAEAKGPTIWAILRAAGWSPPRADDAAGRPSDDRHRLGVRTPGAVLVRAADVSEAGELTELTVRSKASWGYDDAFMHQVHGDLVVSAAAIASGRVMVAERRGRIVGYYQLHLDPPSARLHDLFVDPEHHGIGLGRLLWEHASAAALEHHCTTMTLEADPNAESFYRHLGAHRTGTTETSFDRHLPVMTFQL